MRDCLVFASCMVVAIPWQHQPHNRPIELGQLQDRVKEIGHAPPNFPQLDMKSGHGVVHAPIETYLAGPF